ncbi:MAG: MCE family protein [Marinilabiliaceae bacterium]|nr:MCE family protein [Marinilabiliaceae bacterium]
MMKFSREYKVGLLVISSFFILLWGINFLKGNDIFTNGKKYYGVYASVDGLSNASPVYYKGFKIGNVRNIKINNKDKVNFIVTFSISHDILFPSNTLAQIYSLDLMGSKGVQFIEGNSKECLSPGDTLNSAVIGDIVDQMSMQVLPLKEKTERLIVKLDSSLTKLGIFFDERNKDKMTNMINHIEIGLENFAIISEQLKEQLNDDGSLNHSINQFDSLVTSVYSNRSEIDNIIRNFSEVSDNLKNIKLEQSVSSANSMIAKADSLLESVKSGDGTLGMIVQDKELYFRIIDAMSNLERLLLDIKHNPKRYLSFSAVDLGKNVYIKDNGLGKDGLVFMVLIAKSKTPLEIKGVQITEELRIYEDFDGKMYIYTTGQKRTYDEALEIQKAIKDKYPDTDIIAYEFGQSISLKKAVKNTQW